MDESSHEDSQTGVDQLRRAVAFFSEASKCERERWVCRELLRSAAVEFAESEVTLSVNEPPDVCFRTARFEVKEILDPGRKRHREYKDALVEALANAGVPNEQIGYSPKDITPVGVGELIQAKLSELANHYAPAVKANLDALFYVNLTEHWLTAGSMPQPQTFAQYGWRSVSAVYGGRHALFFYATASAPEFLRTRQGTALAEIVEDV